MTAIGLGVGSWLLAALMKLTGKKVINWMPEFGEDAKALKQAKARQEAARGAINYLNQRDAEQKDTNTGMDFD